MSAFIVQPKTLQTIVNFLRYDAKHPSASGMHGYLARILAIHGFDMREDEGADRLINSMNELNHLAVNVRYSRGGDTNKIKFPATGAYTVDLVQVFKYLDCFLYQCDEGGISKTSVLYKIIDEVRRVLGCSIVRKSMDYSEAVYDRERIER